jgi:phosphoribosylformylglycinamidine (FGAM) synthase-like enzyme
MNTPIEDLKAVLCDPEGKCCITGSDGDRRVVDDALRELAAAIAQRDEKDRQLADCYNRMCNAEAQRDKDMSDALEQAAKVCDEYAKSGVTGAMVCAAAIRRMKVEK